MSSNTYFKLRRQLVENARALRVALSAKRRDESLIKRLSDRVTALIARLQEVISLSEIRRILAGVGLAFALQGATGDIQAQSFAAPTVNPFGLQNIYNGAWIDAADIDNDGDLDVFIGSYEEYSAQLNYFENTGTAEEAAFAAPVINPFGIEGDFDLFIMPEFADIDDDGDLDLIAGYVYGLVFLENTGDAENPAFSAPIDAPFGFEMPGASYIYRPNLADLDGDGDLDLLTGGSYDNDINYEAGIYYFENTGSASQAQFAEGVLNPFGMTWVYYFSFPTLADLDNDGDLDLLVGDVYYYAGSSDFSKLVYFENTGDAQNPEFTNRQENPFGLTGGYYISYPCFADMDNDGDPDLFVGQTDSDDYEYGNFLYFENLGSSSTQAIINSEQFQVSPNPAGEYLNIISDLNFETLEIIDALGRVHTRSLNRARIDISDVPAGLATLRAIGPNGDVFLRKVMVVR